MDSSTQAAAFQAVSFLWMWAIEHRERYKKTQLLSDLDGAIDGFRRAVRVHPGGRPDRADLLMQLGAALNLRYQKTRQLFDLDEALSYAQQAVEATPNDGPNRGSHMQDLGIGLLTRFRRTEQLADLDHAIGYFQQAVTARENLPDQPSYKWNLGAGLHYRYRRTRNLDDLKYVIMYFREAVDYPSIHPCCRRDLGIGLRDLHRRTRHMESLSEAIKCFEQALAALPNRTPDADRASCMWELGVALIDQHQSTHHISSLNQAIDYLQQALKAIPDRHPYRAGCAKDLADSLGDRHRRTRDPDDLRRSTEASKVSLRDPFAFPLTRLRAGRIGLQNLIEEKNWEASAKIVEELIQVLPELTPPLGRRNDLEHSIRSVSGLGSLAASVLLKAKKPPAEALQALESCRGLIAGLMMDANSDVSILKDQQPDLWTRYTKCRQQIAELSNEDQFTSSTMRPKSHVAMSDERQRLSKHLTDLRNEIRQCPGLEKFLLAPTEMDIRKLAEDGPMVSFNCSRIGSEAFLITTAGIRTLPLPDLKQADIQRRVKLLASRGNPTRRDGNLSETSEIDLSTGDHARRDGDLDEPDEASMSTELWSLWIHAVKPVLDQLELLDHDATAGQLPRLWWVGGGLMALMPLHAAGEHAPGSKENTISHVVSSYASTLKTLQLTHSRSAVSLSNPDPNQKILIVAMPVTPGPYKPLKVAGEIAGIESQSLPWASTSCLDRPSRESVLYALGSCTIAHFACHAIADNIDPGKSALLLGREVEERLVLEDMDGVNLEHAQIAYLSACSTAEIKVRDLADESIHLASAFQLAGFLHVIGTLWGADDDAAVQISCRFYEALHRYNNKGKASVARALHSSVLSYRNEESNSVAVEKWAPFIHLGC